LVLRRAERLLNSFGFKRVLRFGRCFRHSAMRIHFKESSYELSRMGLVVSKKMGNAVARNLIKRRLREMFRRSKTQLPFTQDVVFIPNPAHGPATLEEYQHVFDEFIEWVRRNRQHPSSNRRGRPSGGERRPRKKRGKS
jgi:ribonuclease P protein component